MSFVILGVVIATVLVRVINNLSDFGTLTKPTCQKNMTWSRRPVCSCRVCRRRRELDYAEYRRRRRARY